MREYVVQYNNGRHSCAPIALLNALRFQGCKVTRRHLPWLAKKLGIHRTRRHMHGVNYMDFERVGGRMGAFKRLRRASNKRVEDQLKNGDGVLVRILTMDHDGAQGAHVFLLSAIWIHGDLTKMYVCNVGGCKWRTWDEIHRYYDKNFKCHHIISAWTVPQSRKKRLRLPT